jgi:hypothetical protein
LSERVFLLIANSFCRVAARSRGTRRGYCTALRPDPAPQR